MNDIQLLLEGISHIKDITPVDLLQLTQLATRRELAAGAVYITEGASSRQLAFIEKGIIRTYAVKENGDEATLLLRWEGQFIASHDTIILNRPSRFIYRAVEPVILLEIDYGELERVMSDQPRLEPLRTFFLKKMLAESLDLIASFVLLSPEERYLKLVEEKADIVSRVPGKYIASLLGVTPVSLSRIRKRISQHRD